MMLKMLSGNNMDLDMDSLMKKQFRHQRVCTVIQDLTLQLLKKLKNVVQ